MNSGVPAEPDARGKNLSSDWSIVFRVGEEELIINNTIDSVNEETVEKEGNAESDGNANAENSRTSEMAENSENSGSHSPNPEYRKMLKNWNEITEKFTKSFEDKISEIKSDFNSSRHRLLSSKDNSSISDSEDNSEKKSADPVCSENAEPETSLDLLPDDSDSKNELRQRKSIRLPDFLKVQEGKKMDSPVDVEMAEEAQEGTEEEEEEYGSTKLSPGTDLSEISNGEGSGNPEEPNGEEHLIGSFVRYSSYRANRKLAAFGIFLLVSIFVTPLTPFLVGFLSCLTLVVFWLLISQYLGDVLEPNPYLPVTQFEVPNYQKRKPLKVPQTPSVGGEWFNEYTRPYDPDDYSVSQTVPVYLELEDSCLMLSRPKKKISKRATCDERKYKLEFVHKRIYDLRECRVMLKPEGIIRRRFFSKKYPIVIELKPNSLLKAVRIKESNSEEEEINIEHTYKVRGHLSNDLVYGKNYLNLFARCNRQKEEWYRRLRKACKFVIVKGESDSEDEDVDSTDLEKLEYEEYWEYMSQFIGECDYDVTELKNYFGPSMPKPGKKKKKDNSRDELPPQIILKLETLLTKCSSRTCKSSMYDEDQSIKSCAIEVQWFNALINRVLFDVFRSPNWLSKIQSKIQRKLGTLRLPYYVEALEIVDLNLGKVGPRFHRISAPLMDERGLWVDMDMTFDGSFKMVVQTQLNLLKLQKGLEEEVKKLPDDKPAQGMPLNEDKKEPKPRKSNPESTSESKQIVANKPKKKEVPIDIQYSERELLMEVAEIVVTEETEKVKAKSSINGEEYSESTDSEEEDDDEDDYDDHLEEVEVNSSSYTPQEATGIPEVRKTPRRSSKRILRAMENFAQSRYFKSLAEMKYVHRAIVGVSATKLKLVLEIKSCIGTLAINMPPPPSDRIWYGFRQMPKLWMSAHPKVGDRSIHFSHIKHFVERKILQELKKVIVIPNMDDVPLPMPPDDIVITKILNKYPKNLYFS